MYRCLLRVSHVVSSPHTLRAKDIKWTSEGVDISIRSSKTIQFKEKVIVVPVIESPGSALCPCGFLKQYMANARLDPDAPLFPYTYNAFAARFKRACREAGLVGNYTTHSLRRGAATFLASFLPLHVVKTYGDWASWAVLLYVSDNYKSRKGKDVLVADKLSKYY